MGDSLRVTAVRVMGASLSLQCPYCTGVLGLNWSNPSGEFLELGEIMDMVQDHFEGNCSAASWR